MGIGKAIPVQLMIILGMILVFRPSASILPPETKQLPRNDNVLYDLKTEKILTSLKINEKPKPVAKRPASQTPKPQVVRTASISIDHANTAVIEIIREAAREFGVNEQMMLDIAYCESGFREEAVSGPYAGIYQFLSSTWESNRKAMGEDPNPNLRVSPRDAARTAAFKMSRDGFGAWPVCSKISNAS